MNEEKKDFAVFLGGKDVRIVVGKDAIEKAKLATPKETCLLNPDLAAVKGLAPHHWEHQSGKIGRRKHQSLKRSKLRNLIDVAVITAVFTVVHFVLRHFGV